jgi:hypothetical protein
LRSGQPGLPDHWSVADWCDQCHRKKGLVVWADTSHLSAKHPQGEALAALVLGKIDAFEVGPEQWPDKGALRDYYGLLACGLRPVLVAGSGKNSNARPLGVVRTYARLLPGEELSSANWIEAVRAGRTFITNGPMLSLSVAEQGVGATVEAQPGQRVPIRAEARSASPLSRLEVLANGEVIGEASAEAQERRLVVEMDFPCTQSAWIAARCQSAETSPAGLLRFAHTNPVHLEVAGSPLTEYRAETRTPLLALLDQTLAWVDQEAKCETERHRNHLREILMAARQKLAGQG